MAQHVMAFTHLFYHYSDLAPILLLVPAIPSTPHPWAYLLPVVPQLPGAIISGRAPRKQEGLTGRREEPSPVKFEGARPGELVQVSQGS